MKIRHVLSLALFTLTSLSLFATTASEVHKIGEVDQPPLFTKRVAPTYPEKARNDKVQDYVILEATLGKDGSISDIKTLRSGKKGYDLDKAAAEALGKWEFRPGEKGDQPVDVRMTLKIDFVLQPEDDKKEDAGDDN